MKGVKISIIVPVYNVADYLSRCLDSLITQTLYDIEIICVNDGTKDNSVEIIKSYIEKDSRVKLYNKENGGLSSARNYGLKYATGKYVAFVDSDDYVEKNFCERLYRESLENWADIIVFGASIFPRIGEINSWLVNNLSTKTRMYDVNPVKALFWENGAHPFVWRNCFNRAFLARLNAKFAEDARFAEDVIFQFETFPFANKIVFIEDKLYHYRHCRDNSLMNQYDKNIGEKYDYHVRVVEHIADFWEKNELLKNNEYDFLMWMLGYVINDLLYFEHFPQKTENAGKIVKIIYNNQLQNEYKNMNKNDLDAFRKLEKLSKHLNKTSK